MKEKTKKRRFTPGRAMVSAVMLFYFLAFFLLGFKAWDWRCFALAVVVPVIVLFGSVGLSRLFPADTLLLSLTNFLCALGVLVLYRLDPERGLSQAVNYGVGVAAMMGCTLLIRYIPSFRLVNVLLMLGSVALLALPLVIGTERNGAHSWITVGGRSFQPSEMVKISLLISLCYLLAKRKVVISMGFAAVCVLILAVQNDFGTALLYFGTALVLGFAATGSLLLVLAGAGGAGAAVVLGNMLLPEKFARAMSRVEIWLNPWQDVQGAGYQIVQGLIAMANGGLWGVGFGAGNATVIPEHYNDFIFAVIVNEFGLLFALVVLGMFAFIVIRGIMIARGSRTVFHALLATGCAAMIALQTFVIIGGNIKLIPLTGITLPFISYGGTSLVSSLCIIGLMQGVSARNAAGVDQDRALAMQGGDGL